MKIKTLILSAIACMLSFSSCEDDEAGPNYGLPNPMELSAKAETKNFPYLDDVWSMEMFIDIGKEEKLTYSNRDSITYDWIKVVDFKKEKKLEITVKENTTGKPRNVEIGLSSGNYRRIYNIVQKSE